MTNAVIILALIELSFTKTSLGIFKLFILLLKSAGEKSGKIF